MTSHSKKPAKKVYRKRSEMTPKEAAKAEKKAAYQRKWQAQQKAKRAVNATEDRIPELEFTLRMSKSYEAKIASLEHQAVQYRTVIDYLESKIDSMRTAK